MRNLLPALSLAVSLFTIGTASAADTVTFAGSSTVFPVMEAMMPVFEKHGIIAEIQGGGSSAGIKAAKMGMADIGMISRELSKKESKYLENQPIARDWVVMIVHKDVPGNDITHDEVLDIYTGKTNKFKGYKLHPIAKEDGRATKHIFDHYFHLGKKAGHPLDPSLVIIGANGQAIAAVAGDPRGMTYISYSAAIRAINQGEPIKMLTLDGVEGSPENVTAGKYTMSRNLNLVYKSKNEELMKRIRKIFATKEARKVFLANNVMPAL